MRASICTGVVAAWCLVAGCGDGREASAGIEVVPPETTMIPVSPLSAARDSGPGRIFYDLTRFDWYARGEPLIWAEREWQPQGAPVAAATADLRHLGEFGGVDVWGAADTDSLERIFVPVSEGYWLRFVPESR